MFAANLVHAAWTDYEEKRDLSLDAEGVQTLQIEAGAGGLDVTGIPGTTKITVGALIRVPDADADEAQQMLSEDLVLSLDRNGGSADLKAYFENSGRLFGNSPSVSLEVRVPAGMSLDVEDGSGPVEVHNVRGDISLDDGSGSIQMTDSGGWFRVRDGSGSITINGAGGDIEIVDGSGSIAVTRVQGSVTVEDGSGSIDVSEVSGDLFILEDGSGSIDYSAIAGRVETDD
jgi:DUF4097 and DUF4098 domain-containing protein YvlB